MRTAVKLATFMWPFSENPRILNLPEPSGPTWACIGMVSYLLTVFLALIFEREMLA
jgi:hypothetical protein